jgi:hypothetical protein
MTLRLAGEELGALQGVDGAGWLREVLACDSGPALAVDQQGSGRVLDFRDGGASVLYMNDGGALVLLREMDARQPLKNTGAANGGAVAVDDGLRVAGVVQGVSGGLPGTVEVEMNRDHHALILRERASHIADGDIAEDYGFIYVYNSGGGTRQLVVKHKDGGTIYTGALALV